MTVELAIQESKRIAVPDSRVTAPVAAAILKIEAPEGAETILPRPGDVAVGVTVCANAAWEENVQKAKHARARCLAQPLCSLARYRRANRK